MHKGRIADHRYSTGVKSIRFKDCENASNVSCTNHNDECHQDDCFIMAYVDGELDEDGRRAIEAMLERDPRAKETAETFRSMTMLLREAFLEPFDCSPSPVPGTGGTCVPNAVPSRSK
jgi:hypothetical protein